MQPARRITTHVTQAVIPQTGGATTIVAMHTTYVRLVVRFREGIVVRDVAPRSITAVQVAMPNTMLAMQAAMATVVAKAFAMVTKTFASVFVRPHCMTVSESFAGNVETNQEPISFAPLVLKRDATNFAA